MKFSIGTFNAENLIGPNKPIYHEKRPHFTVSQYKDKIAWIASQLNKMNTDIIGFQEVFDEHALRDCIKDLEVAGYQSVVVANPTGKEPANALISRFPIKSTQIIDKIPSTFDFFDDLNNVNSSEKKIITVPIDTFTRGVLLCEIEIKSGFSIVVCVIHLKSKRPILNGMDANDPTFTDIAKGTMRSLFKRGIEACGIREIISSLIDQNPAVPVVVLGDLNDTDSAVTSQAILGEPPYSTLPTEQKSKKWNYVFQNSKDIQARKSIENYYYTYIHNGKHECLDNIFFSNHFAEQNPNKVGKIIDVRLFTDHLIDATVSRDVKPRYVSDHGQVKVNVELYVRKK